MNRRVFHPARRAPAGPKRRRGAQQAARTDVDIASRQLAVRDEPGGYVAALPLRTGSMRPREDSRQPDSAPSALYAEPQRHAGE